MSVEFKKVEIGDSDSNPNEAQVSSSNKKPIIIISVILSLIILAGIDNPYHRKSTKVIKYTSLHKLL